MPHGSIPSRLPEALPVHPLASPDPQEAIPIETGTESVRDARRLRDGHWVNTADSVAQEWPIALQYNGIGHAVMLATPNDLEDFAIGFSITEGIVERVGEIHDFEILVSSMGITVAMQIASARFDALKQRRRGLAGRTGCGLCGVEQLNQARMTVPRLEPTATQNRFDPIAVASAVRALRALQPLHDLTGATHAAGFADRQGVLLHVREDVGRHNALDKLIGALLRSRLDPTQGMALITSRASHEMVAKAARARIPLLAAVSGVTGLAIDTADEAGLCLLGFVRGDDLTVYA
jgi:FdhD protein